MSYESRSSKGSSSPYQVCCFAIGSNSGGSLAREVVCTLFDTYMNPFCIGVDILGHAMLFVVYLC